MDCSGNNLEFNLHVSGGEPTQTPGGIGETLVLNCVDLSSDG